MHREVLVQIRRTTRLMAVFAAAFIFVYTGVVLLTKFVYIYFKGFIPETSELILRAIFYGLSALLVITADRISKRRYSPESIGRQMNDADSLVRHLLFTPVITMGIAEAVLICAFFLFFLSAMYADYFILSALSLMLIIRSVPGVDFLEERLKAARGR